MTLLTATNLGIMRGDRVLFQGLSVEVAAGEAVILRGANGSGKTTLLRILAGLTRPDAGSVECACPCHWVGHREGLKPHETPQAHLSLWASAWGARPSAVPSLLERAGLQRAADVPARLLSAGQRRRSALARLLLEDRPLWLLDEPAAALDSEGAGWLGHLIDGHRAKGGAILAAVHGKPVFDADREIAL